MTDNDPIEGKYLVFPARYLQLPRGSAALRENEQGAITKIDNDAIGTVTEKERIAIVL